MTRAEAFQELDLRLNNKNLVKHCIAVENIMLDLAKYLGEDEEIWRNTGLLHDIDFEKVNSDLSLHGIVAEDILGKLFIDEAIIYAIKAHNPFHQLPRRRKVDQALYCSDPISGLITACALILPSKKLEDVDVAFVNKRFKENGFAKGANREQIKTCSDLGIELDEFIQISLGAMQRISDVLGL